MSKNMPPYGGRKTEASPLTETDKKVWSEITKTVTPLRDKTAPLYESKAEVYKTEPSNTSGTIKRTKPSVREPLKTIGENRVNPQFTLNLASDLTHGDTTQMHKSQGRRFIRGQIPIDDRLDLHGMTQDKAHSTLNRFVIGAYDKGFRKIILVTGKGKGILQNAVPRWLNADALKPYILSFSYAQPQDGGHGALYVLLRRNRTIIK